MAFSKQSSGVSLCDGPSRLIQTDAIRFNQFSFYYGQAACGCQEDIPVVGCVQFTAEVSRPSRVLGERSEKRGGAFSDRQVCLVPKVRNR